MKKNFESKVAVMMIFFLSIVVGNAFAAGPVVEKEKVTGVVITKEIIRTADNFIVMFDSSSSMKEPYQSTGLTTLDAAKKLLKDRNEILPDLGYNGGLYLYTPFKPVIEMQPYDRKSFAQAIDRLPSKASGPTLLQKGLLKLDAILAGLSGRTVVFLFTDGQYSRMPGSRKPVEIARGLADKYNVCFYVISTAKGDQQKEVLKAVASINECSRVVPFDQVYEKPVYLAGALFVIETTAEKFVATFNRITDFKVNNVLFEFDSDQIRPEYHDGLNSLGKFLQDNAETYVVLTGFTDGIGDSEYNLGLSRRRAQSVEAYLASNFNIGIGRIVTQWYGKLDPVAGNDTSEGRRQNRRVESIVMGFD